MELSGDSDETVDEMLRVGSVHKVHHRRGESTVFTKYITGEVSPQCSQSTSPAR